jgi:hypothetical protein
MNMKLLSVTAAVVFMSCVSPVSAGQVTLYDNLGATTAGGIGLTDIPFQSFSTEKYAVSSLEVIVYLTGVSDFGDFTVTLTSDKSGAPNPTPIDFQANSVFDLPGDYFSFFNDALNPDTRYWIVVGGPTSAQWAYATDSSGIGVAGQPWGVSSGSNASGPFQMEVLATVPEASTWAMMLVGLAGLSYAGRWARRNAAELRA